jgi:integrase
MFSDGRLVMARTLRDAKLDTRNARSKLKARKEPYWRSLSEGLALGYYKGAKGGTWIARHYCAEHGRRFEPLGTADDVADADRGHVLSFGDAQRKAREWFQALARRDNGEPETGPYSVSHALDDYESDLKIRRGDPDNVQRARAHLSAELLARPVAALNGPELRRWRDKLAKQMAPASVNRTVTCLKAALNLAADKNERIARGPWVNGLKAIPDAEHPRNLIISDATVRSIVEECYRTSPAMLEHLREPQAREKAAREAERWASAFGLLVEVLAVTGARVSQVARLECQDVQSDRSDPRLMMPTSKKGKGVKKVDRRPVPIPAALALKLRRAATNRPAPSPLLVKPTGELWKKSDHVRPFDRAVKRLCDKARDEAAKRGGDPGKAGAEFKDVTIYALRHSSIVRQIVAGTPIRVIAAHHDTSVKMIEDNYSRYISDHTDALARKGLLDVSPPPSNVTMLATAG